MPSYEQSILLILSDGRFHSGQQIGKRLGISRTMVWKVIEHFKTLGIVIQAVQGKGYRIPGGIDLIHAESLQAGFKKLIPKENIEVLTSVASTNQYLILKTRKNAAPYICLAEYQSAGKGRRGRYWHSPFAQNIYCSIRLILPLSIEELSGLSLMIGCTLADQLESLGIQHIGLKWPNDLRIQSKKVAGILIEIAEECEQGVDIVIGIGVNWNMSLNESSIDQAWDNILGHMSVDMNRTAFVQAFIERLWTNIDLFNQSGFTTFLDNWHKWDDFRGKTVCLSGKHLSLEGKVLGCDASGALLLQTEQGIERVISGEISVKALS